MFNESVFIRFIRRVCFLNIIWTARIMPRACTAAVAEFPAILGNRFIRGKYDISTFDIDKMNDIK